MCSQEVVEASIRIVKPDAKERFTLSPTANKSATRYDTTEAGEGTATRSVASRTATLEEFIPAVI